MTTTMLPVQVLDARHLGLVREKGADPGRSMFGQGRVVCRIVHEAETRLGTFLGHATDEDPTLQRWGSFFGRPHDPVWLDGTPAAGSGLDTAGQLKFGDLTSRHGQPFGFDDPKLDAEFEKTGATRNLIRIDHTYSWDGDRIVGLDFMLHPDAPRQGFMGRDWLRITVSPTTRIVRQP